MTWAITHKPSYDAEYIDLSKDLQRRTIIAIEELEQDPVSPRGNTIKPLKGWTNLYRYRIGDYRLIYSAAIEQRVVQLLAIGPRSEIYRRFQHDDHVNEENALTFGPGLAKKLQPRREAIPVWQQNPQWFQPTTESGVAAEMLPRKLTPRMLSQWLIPTEFHSILMHCRTDEELLEADMPDEILGRVMDVLWPPAPDILAQQPDQMLFDPSDLEEYAAGTLRSFLLRLDENQRKLVDWALNGPTLVKGGPGAGKSTVAIYRVKTLIEHEFAISRSMPRLLFTTYTNALTHFSEALLEQLLNSRSPISAHLPSPALVPLEVADSIRGVTVSTVDKVAYHIVTAHGAVVHLASSDQRSEALRSARAMLQPSQLGDLEQMRLTAALTNLRDEYLLDEFEWVLEGQDIRSEEEYLAVERRGRVIPLRQHVRRAVWRLYEVYSRVLAHQNLMSWGQLRQRAVDDLRSGRCASRFDYVIVDEAQDLTPCALTLCLKLCKQPSGLFLTADANQSLYNRGFHWSQVHEQLRVVGRTRLLYRNYRNTRYIMEAASEIVVEADNVDAEAITQEYVHQGVPPVTYAASGTADQARWLAYQINLAARDLRLPVSAAAVLTPTRRLGERLAELLQEQGMPAEFMASSGLDLTKRCVKVMTIHTAKGLEFPVVAIAHVEADRLPRDITRLTASEQAEQMAEAGRLLYTGCTRAMRRLFITYDRSLPSPLLENLSEDRWLRFE